MPSHRAMAEQNARANPVTRTRRIVVGIVLAVTSAALWAQTLAPFLFSR
ncbi:hypothetical protein RA307_23730 [Xanthobacteraceae bacterium Astr-EGSB]|nr:hypothetical protein [Xanthobacteraceae bacterium Astr-EGSB]